MMVITQEENELKWLALLLEYIFYSVTLVLLLQALLFVQAITLSSLHSLPQQCLLFFICAWNECKYISNLRAEEMILSKKNYYSFIFTMMLETLKMMDIMNMTGKKTTLLWLLDME